MFKGFTTSADFQLDVGRKRDVFISHSPRHRHLHFHCLFVIFMHLHVEHTKASLLVIVVVCLFKPKWESRSPVDTSGPFWTEKWFRGCKLREWRWHSGATAVVLIWYIMVLMRHITWSETMRSEWQMIHFECRQKERVVEQTLMMSRKTPDSLGVSTRIKLMFIWLEGNMIVGTFMPLF